jgi:hypothetical protein
MLSPSFDRRQYVSNFCTLAVQAWKGRLSVESGTSKQAPENPILYALELVNARSLKSALAKFEGKRVEFFEVMFDMNFMFTPDQRREMGKATLSPTERIVNYCSNYATDIVDRLSDFLLILGYDITTLSDTWIKYHDLYYASLFLMGVWADNLKYHIACLFSHYEGQDLPNRSDKIVGKDGFLLCGKPYAFLSQKLSKYSLKGAEARLTLLQGLKKSFLPLDARKIYETMREHKSCLGTERECPEEFLEECLRTGREFRNYLLPYRIGKSGYFSTHACIESNRGAGGFMGHFYENELGLELSRQPINSGKTEFGRLVMKNRMRSWISWAASTPILCGMEESRTRAGKYRFVYTKFPLDYEEVWRTARSKFWDDLWLPRAQVRLIPEPLKCRVISLGNYNIYAGLRPRQQQLWKTMQRLPCFALTGWGNKNLVEPVEDLITQRWKDGYIFLSGDYKASTDMINTEAGRYVLKGIFESDPLGYCEVEGALLHSLIDYDNALKTIDPIYGVHPELDSLGLSGFSMENGWLMGNPLSFVLLCLVNFTVCRVAEEMYRRSVQGENFDRVRLINAPFLINGDDLLMVCHPSVEKHWEDVGKMAGLVKSVGKSYNSPHFAMINSRYIAVGRKEAPSGITYAFAKKDVGYVNLGILVGRKKGNHEDCEVRLEDKTCDETLHKFWQSFRPNFDQMYKRIEKLPKLFRLYCERWKRFLSRVPIPLDLPRSLGGFGCEDLVETPDSFSWTSKKFDFAGPLFPDCRGGIIYGNMDSFPMSQLEDSNGFLCEAFKFARGLSNTTIVSSCQNLSQPEWCGLVPGLGRFTERGSWFRQYLEEFIPRWKPWLNPFNTETPIEEFVEPDLEKIEQTIQSFTDQVIQENNSVLKNFFSIELNSV